MANRVVSSTSMASGRHDHKRLKRLNCGLAIVLAAMSTGITIAGYALYNPASSCCPTTSEFDLNEGVPIGGEGGGSEIVPTPPKATTTKPIVTPKTQVVPTPKTTTRNPPRRSPPPPPSPLPPVESPRTTMAPAPTTS